MVGLTSTYDTQVGNALTNQGTVTEVTTPFLGLLTAVTNDSTVTEAAYTGYAREAVAFNAGTLGVFTNNGSVAFPACTNGGTAVVETEIAIGEYTAVSGGTLVTWDYIGPGGWQPCNVSLASPGVITCDGTTFVNGQFVAFSKRFGGTMPTGINEFQVYTVAGVSGNTFNVGANTSSVGNPMVKQVVPQPIVNNTTPIVNSGSFALTIA